MTTETDTGLRRVDATAGAAEPRSRRRRTR